MVGKLIPKLEMTASQCLAESQFFTVLRLLNSE